MVMSSITRSKPMIEAPDMCLIMETPSFVRPMKRCPQISGTATMMPVSRHIHLSLRPSYMYPAFASTKRLDLGNFTEASSRTSRHFESFFSSPHWSTGSISRVPVAYIVVSKWSVIFAVSHSI